tara:strand:- start:1620 stop:2066 length:447 start_codon:yes stop_codon:yes gene_type:complete
MILISHRGNIDGPNPGNENKPSYILDAIVKGYEVEVDFWFSNNKFYLGHDEPQYDIPIEWLENNYRKLWIHCKNVDAISKLHELDRGGFYLNYFWHENDKVTLTSQGYIWAYPGVKCSNGIAVMPELNKNFLPKDVLGICSDYIINYE